MCALGLSGIDTTLQEMVVCPACKQLLVWHEDTASCVRCDRVYPIRDGVPILAPPDNRRTVRVEDLRLKDRDEACSTVRGMLDIDAGLIHGPRLYYLLYAVMILALATGLASGAILIAAVLLADWFVFVRRRARVLARYEAAELRLRTLADMEAVDALYRSRGLEQPTMFDWVSLSEEASRGRSRRSRGEETHDFDDERYVEVLQAIRKMEPAPRVVVDVGANDGRASYRFGIGAEGALLGIDVSELLLQRFRENFPHGIPLLADGVSLPLKDDSVDFLFSTETLEHLAEPDAAVAEFIRVLRPGGRLMIQSPNAHRIRNLNPFHFLSLVWGLIDERLLQKKVVHENTWHNAVTYHWDFSIRDYRRMAAGRGARILSLTSRGFFVPRSILRGSVSAFRAKERLFRALPIFRWFGEDLVLIVEKKGESG